MLHPRVEVMPWGGGSKEGGGADPGPTQLSACTPTPTENQWGRSHAALGAQLLESPLESFPRKLMMK